MKQTYLCQTSIPLYDRTTQARKEDFTSQKLSASDHLGLQVRREGNRSGKAQPPMLELTKPRQIAVATTAVGPEEQPLIVRSSFRHGLSACNVGYATSKSQSVKSTDTTRKCLIDTNMKLSRPVQLSIPQLTVHSLRPRSRSENTPKPTREYQ